MTGESRGFSQGAARFSSYDGEFRLPLAAFKAQYLRRTLSQLAQDMASADQPSVWEFWRSYTVMTAVDNIAEAWAELQPAAMNSAWRKLWPDKVKKGLQTTPGTR